MRTEARAGSDGSAHRATSSARIAATYFSRLRLVEGVVRTPRFRLSQDSSTGVRFARSPGIVGRLRCAG